MKKCVYSDYVHTDRLGSVVNLTDQYGRVPAQVDYDDWGKVTAYQSLSISGGYRTVLPEITYAGHQYDDVLGMYYAKARMYDAENRRFASVDPVKGNITEPMTLVQYVYCVDNGLLYVDSTGKVPILLKYIAAEDKANFSYGFTPHTTLWGLITYKYTVSITIDDKTVEYNYQNIGGNAVIDSDWLVEDFGFNREDVEHQAGDTFANMSEAALAWSLKYYALSNDKDNHREYGSLIYCNSGLYSFTEPNIGEKDRVQFPHNPENTSIVAGIHSHPDLLFYNSENFSGQVTSNGGDIAWVENVRLPLYLATPSGKVKLAYWDKTGEVV